MIVMGILVAFVLIALYMPIFSLADMITRTLRLQWCPRELGM
jgi:hypothetical protein